MDTGVGIPGGRGFIHRIAAALGQVNALTGVAGQHRAVGKAVSCGMGSIKGNAVGFSVFMHRRSAACRHKQNCMNALYNYFFQGFHTITSFLILIFCFE